MKRNIDIHHQDGQNHQSMSINSVEFLNFLFDLFYSSKRRKNDEISKDKKKMEDGIEDGESPVTETKPTERNNEAANGTSTTKRVPLSLEEMLEKNKKEQEATAKVFFKMLCDKNLMMFISFSRNS